jgi:hypothetical protein
MKLFCNRLVLAASIGLFPYTGQAATLTCGNLPCEEVATQIVPWPSHQTNRLGFPVRDGPKLELTIPTGFERFFRFDNLITFFYRNENSESSISFLSYDIPQNGKNGPLGGWETLRKAEKDGLKAYYYLDESESIPTYVAVLINTKLVRIDGKLTCLELITRGFSETEFLEILSTANAVKNADS